MPSSHERVVGALRGLATGDAVGKQTENLTRAGVLAWYPSGLRGFEGPSGSVIPRYAGKARSQWRFGETTDDTERTIAVAKAVLGSLPLTHTAVGEELLKCTKSIHPGVTSYWEFHQGGDPARIAEGHDGCGAAIRMAPIGIAYRPQNKDELIAAAYQASIPTHGGPLAVVAAAATAAGISAAIEGWPAAEVASFSVSVARSAELVWPPPDGASISSAIAGTCEDLLNRAALHPSDLANAHFPNRPLTIVPLAIALATATRSAEAAILMATNIGGDSDSVASIAGALAGAMYPETVNNRWYEVVEEVNQHGLSIFAEALLVTRGQTGV